VAASFPGVVRRFRARTPRRQRLSGRFWEVLIAGLLLAAASLPDPALAQACYVPHPGPQSVDWVVTDQPTGLQITDGMALPISSQGYDTVNFHEWGTAYGSCDVYTPGCMEYVTTYNVDVNNLATDLFAVSPVYNGWYYPGHVFGKNPANGTTAFYQVLNDADTTHSTGPIAPIMISAPGA
jgi:hypothetical protein